MTPRAALFLDRDGTIIADTGYLHDLHEVRLLPGAAAALQEARELFRLYLITNQSGIGRGYYNLADAEACNRRMFELLGIGEDQFAGICIAPEHPDEPPRYRKPSPRYIKEMILRDRLDPELCWIIGDRLSDLECGVRAGINAALVRQSPHSATPAVREYLDWNNLPDFANLAEAVAAISTLVRSDSLPVQPEEAAGGERLEDD